jgi:hypothetical protein
MSDTRIIDGKEFVPIEYLRLANKNCARLQNELGNKDYLKQTIELLERCEKVSRSCSATRTSRLIQEEITRLTSIVGGNK